MKTAGLNASEQFRATGRQVLRRPDAQGAHRARVTAAAALEGAEPLQGALADWFYACPAQGLAQAEALRQPAVRQGLGASIWQQFARQLRSSQALPQVNRLATRWSVLAQPSSDVPQRALLCGVDDSHGAAQAAVAAILAGDKAQEAAFLTHCLGAQDTLAFMLARRALQRAAYALDDAWPLALQALEQRGRP